LHGIAPGASILPVRVAGWQPNAEGGYTVYSRTDQILAGLEAAVDPNDDGDTHDAARVALIGVVEPYASFPDGPLAQAVAGATTLDMLVVVPAGNDGGPGRAREHRRPRRRAGRAHGRRVRRASRDADRPRAGAGRPGPFEGPLALGGAPSETVTADVVTVTRAAAAKGIAGFFGADGVSAIAGRASLLPRGALSEEAVEESTTAGALAVLVDGQLPAGAFSLDVPTGVPVVGLPRALVKEMRAFLASGVP
jgi:hypothetical protein